MDICTYVCVRVYLHIYAAIYIEVSVVGSLTGCHLVMGNIVGTIRTKESHFEFSISKCVHPHFGIQFRLAFLLLHLV